MKKESFLFLTALAGAAYGFYYAYKHYYTDHQKNKEKKDREEKNSVNSTMKKSDSSISVDKFVEILKEVNKEFTKEQFMRDKYKTLQEYPTIPEIFLNRQIHPKVEEAYSKITNEIYKKFNVKGDEVDKAADAYIDVPEVAEQRQYIENFFSLFSTDSNEENEENLIIPPDLTIKVLQEELEMNISCLHKAAEEVCKNENIADKDLGKKLHENENLMKEYTNIYTRMIRDEEDKLFGKYNLKTKSIQISVIKHQSDPSFMSEFERILEKRKHEYSRFGLDG